MGSRLTGHWRAEAEEELALAVPHCTPQHSSRGELANICIARSTHCLHILLCHIVLHDTAAEVDMTALISLLRRLKSAQQQLQPVHGSAKQNAGPAWVRKQRRCQRCLKAIAMIANLAIVVTNTATVSSLLCSRLCYSRYSLSNCITKPGV